MDTKEHETTVAPPDPPEPAGGKPVEKPSKRFRLYVRTDSVYCAYLKEVLSEYPAVLTMLEIWIVTVDRRAQHRIRGVPCIVDLVLEQDRSWVGRECFDWMRKAVVMTVNYIPLKMPSEQELVRRYYSPSQSDMTSEETSPSPDIDVNQEDEDMLAEIATQIETTDQPVAD
jgi:hypothetical protein